MVGWALSATALGSYQLAYRLSNAPATEITNVISSVMFHAYSQLQDDPDRLRKAFLRILKLVTFISFPVAIGIVAVAPMFIRAFLGPDWMPMTTVMQILAIWGLMRSFASTSDPVRKAICRPDYVTKLGIIKVALLAVFIYPVTTQYGIEGTAFLLIGTFLFPQWPIELRWVINSTGTTSARYLQTLIYPFILSIVMGLTVVFVQQSLDIQPVLKFSLLIAIRVASYVLVVKVLETWFEWEITGDIRDIADVISS